MASYVGVDMTIESKFTAVIYEGTPGVRVVRDHLRIVGTGREELVDVVLAQVEQGAGRIELCGGLGAEEAASVRAAVALDVRIGLNRYAFESLERIADYKRAAIGGVLRPAAFLYLAPGLDPDRDRDTHADAVFVPVPDAAAVEAVVASLAGLDLGLVELYGGLGVDAAAAAVRGSGGRIPVGFVGYDD
ncbi:DUF6506 family protein [Tenggerimyces flavus]|uniref:DUF6506 family protein n=1 Tax=Tenggerimyces flavus TaxID=1708749 RepID=A0ABV7YPL1_9ACTN|nr:DUF6506 family protein [Tenggerimyces flavus]MBM7790132.1 hypothetical protein [Tenggerimyces flavus]